MSREPTKGRADREEHDPRLAIRKKKLVESYGGTFVAVLQPVSYFGRTQLKNLKLTQEFAPEFKVVYPIMRKEMAASGKEYDLTSAFDVDNEVYIDFCHVTPKGNRIIAEKIADIARPVRHWALNCQHRVSDETTDLDVISTTTVSALFCCGRTTDDVRTARANSAKGVRPS